ncbi:MAG: YceI family protein [Chitinophagaceae bacterium]|nr:YceI family protein [Chitinophagaceae bacterium]
MSQNLFKLCFVFLVSFHGSVTAQNIYGTEDGSIQFHSDAPLELITAACKEMKGKVDLDKKIFAFSVKISAFTGFNSPLQREHFNENYMESTQYPYAFFSGKIIEDIDYSIDGTYTLRAKGKLSVHGVVRERIIKNEVVVKNGVISIRSKFTVFLADHDIAIPKIVYEKLASEINVEIKADLLKQ